MFAELFDTLKVGFGIGITIGIIAMIAGFIKGAKDHAKAEEYRKIEQQKQRERQQERRAELNRIKAASPKWSREYKTQFRDYLVKSWYAETDWYRGAFGRDDDIEQNCYVLVQVDIDGTMEQFSLNCREVWELNSYLLESLN